MVTNNVAQVLHFNVLFSYFLFSPSLKTQGAWCSEVGLGQNSESRENANKNKLFSWSGDKCVVRNRLLKGVKEKKRTLKNSLVQSHDTLDAEANLNPNFFFPKGKDFAI